MNETLTNRPHSGARLIGDDLQYLIAWYWAIALLKPNDIVRVEIEAADAANLDDVVIRRTSSPDTYCQIKASVDATRPLTLAWLTDPSRSGGPSILQRFFTFSSKNTASASPTCHQQEPRPQRSSPVTTGHKRLPGRRITSSDSWTCPQDSYAECPRSPRNRRGDPSPLP